MGIGNNWSDLGHNITTFFHYPPVPGDRNRIQISTQGEEPVKYIRRDLILSATFTVFVVLAMLTFLFIRSQQINEIGYLIMGIMIFTLIALTVPPFQIIKTGYGELIQSILMANIIPGLAFVLQFGELHRLVAMTTFPLALLYLAMSLAFQLPNYAKDVRTGTTNLLTRLGWQRGMVLHNLLILCTFLLFSLAMLYGLSPRVVLPIFFVLPLGLFQIWYMVRIASGAKPNWRLLNTTAIFTFALTAYLLAFSYWVR